VAVLVGEDLSQLQQEVEKLLTYVNGAHPVRREEVLALTPEGAETNVFDMVDAVGARNSSRAVRLLHKLLEEKDPLYAMAMITRQMRLLLVAREVVEDESLNDQASVAHLWCTREQLRRLGRWGHELAQRGRPICGNCGQPMDPSGHFCPRRNGHKH
jgi:DNA polymerase III delta subunit